MKNNAEKQIITQDSFKKRTQKIKKVALITLIAVVGFTGTATYIIDDSNSLEYKNDKSSVINSEEEMNMIAEADASKELHIRNEKHQIEEAVNGFYTIYSPSVYTQEEINYGVANEIEKSEHKDLIISYLDDEALKNEDNTQINNLFATGIITDNNDNHVTSVDDYLEASNKTKEEWKNEVDTKLFANYKQRNDDYAKIVSY